MLSFVSVHQGGHCAREEFLYELKAGPAGGLRPPSGPAATRRSPGSRSHPTDQGEPKLLRARLVGPRRGREQAETKGQQRTATVNNTAGQVKDRLAGRRPRP